MLAFRLPSHRQAVAWVVLLTAAATAAAAGAATVELTDPDHPVSLAVPWKLHAGDDPAWAQPGFDDSDWREISIPAGSGRRDATAEIAWYRLTVRVSDAGEEPRLGLTLGKVESAYQVYAGGLLLGGVGTMPLAPRMDYDRHRTYSVPARAVGADGRLVLALRVWKAPETRGTVGGPTEGTFLVGSLAELTRRELTSELPQLFLAGLFLLLGLFHLELYRRRPQLAGYLWFAATAIQFGAYFLLRTQWKYALSEDFLLLKQVEHLLLFTMTASFFQLMWPILGLRIGGALRVYQIVNLVLALLVALTPGIAVSLRLLPLWQASVVVATTAGVWAVFRQAWRQHPEARIVAVGAITAAATVFNDIAVDRGFLVAPRLVPYGFAALVLSLAASLANRFQRTHTELDELRRYLEQRVEERTRELYEASQAKSRFLATMSHEIRTPLNGVLGMTDLLLGSRLDAEQREYAEMARKSGDVLLSLIDDILDFSKIEAGKVELAERPFRLRQCIEESLDVLSSRAAEKELDLAYIADERVPASVIGDPMRLRQILVNLVGNAVKFTDRGGVLVEVEPGQDGSELHFRVVDTGIGIPEDRQQELFEVFSQVDGSHTRRHRGSGLGLAISRQLGELMGGRMWVESEPGQGSTFHFTVRAAAADASLEAHLSPRQPVLGGRRVLLLEPGTFTRRALVRQLEAWGMEAEAAASADAALERLGAGARCDVAVLGSGSASPGLLAEIRRAALPLIAVRRIRIGDRPEPAPRDVAARLLTPVKPAQLHRLLSALFEGGRAAVEAASSAAQASSASPPSTAAPRPLRILLAEDEEVNRIVALKTLEQIGYRADVATDGREVLEALEAGAYDVVLLDIQMPEVDGLEAARRIRRRWPGAAGPRLIAMTANALHGDREACLAAGMDDYLSKPVGRGELRQALARTGTAGPAPAPAGEPRPAEEPPADDPVLDPEALELLRRLDDGAGETLRHVVELFLSHTPEALEEIAAALAEGDAATARRLAHGLKASSASLGGRRMHAACAALEHAASDGTAVGAGPWLESSRAEFALLRAELEADRAASRSVP